MIINSFSMSVMIFKKFDATHVNEWGKELMMTVCATHDLFDKVGNVDC